MRVDGFSSTSLNRSPRPGTAVTPYREVGREQEERREQPVSTPSASQGLEKTPQQRRVEQANASSDSLPAAPRSLAELSSPLSNRAAQALASYNSTASFVREQDAQEVLGLDLYV